MRLSRVVVVPVVLLLVAGIVVGVLSGAFDSVARRGLYATHLWSDGGASTIAPGSLSTPAAPKASTPAPEPAGAPDAVLAPVTAPPAASAAKVAARVKAVDEMGPGTVSASVMDVVTGKVLYAKNATKAYIPASTLKLVTSTAALSLLGPEHRFSTRVVASGGGRITLVGGGDPYLTATRSTTDPDRASLAQLARLTAASLKKKGQKKVRLSYDASLFSGPSWHPDWPVKYRDQVTPVSALWVNEGRVAGAVGARVTNPTKAAANAFASALEAQGVEVTEVESAKAPAGATRLAAVASLPLERIVEHLLMASDNDAAEVLARQAAIAAGEKGSFEKGRASVRRQLTKLGLWDDSTRIRDGSGLSRSNKVPADLLVKVLRAALEPEHPELRPVATGLPVAGVEGSLRSRYSESDVKAARGAVRGKTGTLTEVHSLAGFVRSRDGSLLAYAFIVNGATDYFTTRTWLDRVSGTLSGCGCR